MEKYTMFMDWKNQYTENEYTTQSNLQIQCNPYQATSHIFHRTRTNNFKICMEIQKKLELPKQSWERRMELEESTCLTLGSTTKPQSSRQYGTGTKIEIQTSQFHSSFSRLLWLLEVFCISIQILKLQYGTGTKTEI